MIMEKLNKDIGLMYSSAVVCFMAMLSAINEVYHTRIGEEVF